MRLIALSLAFLSAPGLGQTVTTNCYGYSPNSWECQSTAPPTVRVNPDAFGSLIRSMPNTAQTMEQGQRNAAAARARQQAAIATKLIAGGNCPGAEAYALNVGNLELAQEVRDYCRR